MTRESTGNLALLAGSANPPLCRAIEAELGQELRPVECERFPDGETHVRIGATVRGGDVYVVQPTGPPVNDNMIELLLLIDACRRAGAARVTAVMPYFGYARHDRRAGGREAIGARVMADVLAAVKLDRVIALDLHSPAIEGFLSMPLEHITAVPVIAAVLQEHMPPDAVVVSLDLGAARLAERYGRVLEVPVAMVEKTRLGPRQVEATEVIGDVRGRSAVIVDDMISTGGTIDAAARALMKAGSRAEFVVAATHGIFAGGCKERFDSLPVSRLLTTDSLQASPGSPETETVRVAPLLAEAIIRVHREQSVSGLAGVLT